MLLGMVGVVGLTKKQTKAKQEKTRENKRKQEKTQGNQ